MGSVVHESEKDMMMYLRISVRKKMMALGTVSDCQIATQLQRYMISHLSIMYNRWILVMCKRCP